MEPFAPPTSRQEFGLPPRCANCYYRLEGLQERRCPECGRGFDPADPRTFTRRPPFVFWTYWLPGLAMAAACGFFCTVIFALQGSIGYSATIAVPLAMGAILGYGVRRRVVGCLATVGLSCLFAVGVALFGLHPQAVYCIAILTGLFTLPLAVGTLLGLALKAALKRTAFSQRAHLPMLVLAVAPLLAGEFERVWAPTPGTESVSTEVGLTIGPEEAWSRLVFYEEVRHEPPLLLRLGLPRPVRTVGHIAAAGDSKTCVYVHGRLLKRATRVEPGRLLAFDVIEQTHVEDHAVRLLGGEFRLEPDGRGRTRLTLTTRYAPLLTPRFCWRPVERAVVHSLHRHVIEGIRIEAEGGRDATRPALVMERAP